MDKEQRKDIIRVIAGHMDISIEEAEKLFRNNVEGLHRICQKYLKKMWMKEKK